VKRLAKAASASFVLALTRLFTMRREYDTSSSTYAFSHTIPEYQLLDRSLRKLPELGPLQNERIWSAFVMMDTRWRVMRHYMTAILLALYTNVRICLRIAFGACESHELYEQFHVAFHQLFDIDPSDCQLESDQSPTFKSVGKWHRHHLICLRHFLPTL
jgi:hypothetical protein